MRGRGFKNGNEKNYGNELSLGGEGNPAFYLLFIAPVY